MQHHWHAKSLPEIFKILDTNEQGLRQQEATLRLKHYGYNKLPEAKPDGLLLMFLRQFKSPLIYLLLAASATIFFIGETTDAVIISAVLLFNAVVGAIQEGRAQNTLLALKKFGQSQATVLRNDKEVILKDQEVVPGDIIVLHEGEKVPADARIITSHNLHVEEAALTGESNPVHKTPETLANPKLETAEQKNMVFKGTHVASGNGKAVVVGTGLHTVIGSISKAIAAMDTEVPLKAHIRRLSHLIIAVVAVMSTMLFFLGMAYGNSAKTMFITVVSLSVSVIPEGLPIVITLVLATGVWRMSKRNALVKKLQAVEALGQADIIAVDKTGTLTRNELAVEAVFIGDKLFTISGAGYDPKGNVTLAGSMVDPASHPELLLAGRIAASSANARVMFSEEDRQWKVSGDPVEAAMLVFAQKMGFSKDHVDQESPLTGEIPFDYTAKYHATARQVNGQDMLAVAGAPEVILAACTLSPERKKELESVFLAMSAKGMRIIALATKEPFREALEHSHITGLSFAGFLGMKDSLRPEAMHAVGQAESAGMKVVMITGDHMVTARAIAKELGIWHHGDSILTGHDLETLPPNELAERIATTSVFARVTPQHKLKIIQAYKARGQTIAMTGDGVNDAPSLVAADLGVAMGVIGTEVAKEAADIVLLDDNFASIIAAVEEGRSIYKTIKKVILYLFSTGLGEALTIIGALALFLPLPILPAQIIWLNFVTDGFLDVALSMEPKEKGLLRQRFRAAKGNLVDGLMVKRMATMALPMMVGALYVFSTNLHQGLAKAQTMVLVTLAVFQWFNAWNCRSEEKSVFAMKWTSNRFLVGATVIVMFLQVLAVYTPFLQKVLHTVPLDGKDWLVIIPIASSILFVEEIRKTFYRYSLKPTKNAVWIFFANPTVKKGIGVILIVLGIGALITPLTPGAAWLLFLGFQFFGWRISFSGWWIRFRREKG